jgi:hypothetical protein
MTTPTVDDTLQSLDVELAQFGGVDLKSATQVTAYVGMVTSALGTTHVGQWAGLPSNARVLSAAAFGLICLAHIVMRYIHHGVVEKHNTTLKLALLQAAQASSVPVVVDSAPAVTGVVDPAPADPIVVDNTSSTVVGSDLPVNDTTTATDTATVDNTTPAPDVSVAAPTVMGLPVQ